MPVLMHSYMRAIIRLISCKKASCLKSWQLSCDYMTTAVRLHDNRSATAWRPSCIVKTRLLAACKAYSSPKWYIFLTQMLYVQTCSHADKLISERCTNHKHQLLSEKKYLLFTQIHTKHKFCRKKKAKSLHSFTKSRTFASQLRTRGARLKSWNKPWDMV